VLIVEASSRLPRTLGLPPEHLHAIHVRDIDVLSTPIASRSRSRGAAVRRRARDRRARAALIPDGATLQTGIGGIRTRSRGSSPSAAAATTACTPRCSPPA
jgi:hypothetical protein